MDARATSTVDRVFGALADPTRRSIVAHLSRGPASVSELARPLPITLAAVVQHVQVLESSGLVVTRKQGRVRTCRIETVALLEAERWLARRRATWEGRLDRVEALLREQDAPPVPEGAPEDLEPPSPSERRGRGEDDPSSEGAS